MSFKFEDFCSKRSGIYKRVNCLRVCHARHKPTFRASDVTLLICLPTSLGGRYSKKEENKAKRPESSSRSIRPLSAQPILRRHLL